MVHTALMAFGQDWNETLGSYTLVSEIRWLGEKSRYIIPQHGKGNMAEEIHNRRYIPIPESGILFSAYSRETVYEVFLAFNKVLEFRVHRVISGCGTVSAPCNARAIQKVTSENRQSSKRSALT